MHERHKIEHDLKANAVQISKELNGAPVIIIVGGTGADIPRTMTASSFKPGDGRLRDLLGILETSIQIETLKHFGKF
jgi:hypothetical protein